GGEAVGEGGAAGWRGAGTGSRLRSLLDRTLLGERGREHAHPGLPPAQPVPPAPPGAPVPPVPPFEPAAPVQPVGRAAPMPAAGRVPAPRTGYDRHAAGYPGTIEWRPAQRRGDHDQFVDLLRRELRLPRVLAFANPKGGVHKTTATVLAAATIGSVRGRGVLAWDDNELRGTLGLRAGSARHARTIRHLVADLLEVEATVGPELAERLDDYLRHASDGSYDVLA